MLDFVFYAMVAAFIAHELDAVKRHEWRVLPLTSFLPDEVGEQVFIWAHLPFLAFLLWGTAGNPDGAMRVGLATFSIIHIGLHALFRKHPAYEFNNVSSWSLIILAGLLGIWSPSALAFYANASV